MLTGGSCVQQGRGGALSEVLQPLEDNLIRACLAVGPWEYNGKPLWHRLLDYAVDAGAILLPSNINQLAW
jgi:hypothetical protein